MSDKDDKKDEKKDEPKVNPELDGFNIKIDSFGEIKTNYDIDKINEFLNKNVEDKKLLEREDYDNIKDTGSFDDQEDDKSDDKSPEDK
ncbi:MAG: hypothetical protein AAFX87_06930 [Bacteroidota bacterium]